MSDFDQNPFADPEAANPFSGDSYNPFDDGRSQPFMDPSVRQATQPQPKTGGLDDFNPFQGNQNTTQAANGRDSRPPPPPQPAVMHPTSETPPPPYSPQMEQTRAATEDLKRRQEELERKAAELSRKEQEMNRNMAHQTRKNNFPPLPDKCCVHPCFYQDFELDIPLEFQKIVKIVYYLWIAYVAILLLNVLCSLAYFIASANGKYGNSSGVTFGLSILYLVLFTPCSFVCWYRPLYKAFRSDSSFNFFVFFFIFFFQFLMTCLLAIGPDGWGSVGVITGLSMVTKGSSGAVTVGVIMIVMGLIFACAAVLYIIVLIKVHRIYRSTGASFEKAQQEFASGVMSNKTVQTTAGNVASSAARSAAQQQFGTGDNRY